MQPDLLSALLRSGRQETVTLVSPLWAESFRSVSVKLWSKEGTRSVVDLDPDGISLTKGAFGFVASAVMQPEHETSVFVFDLS